MRESRKPPSFRKERSPESSDILRAFIICYTCSGHAQATSSSQSFSGHAQALSSSLSISGYAQVLSSSLSFSGHARFCHPRCHSHPSHYRYYVILQIIVSDSYVCYTEEGMFFFMTTIQISWNLSLYSNNNQQWYNNIWTHYTSVIIYFVQLFTFKKGGSVMV